MKISGHILSDATGKPVPFRKSPNHGGALTPTLIVFHDTAGGMAADGSISWLTDPASKVSAHLVLGRDGVITQLLPFNVVAWHAGKSSWRGRSGCNAFSIGVEIVNPGAMTLHANGKSAIGPDRRNYELISNNIRRAADDHHPDAFWMDYTAEQIEAVTQLCAAFKAAYEIEAVTTHWEIAPGRKVDTNPFFPLEHLRAKFFGASDADGPPEVVTVVETSIRRWPSYADNIVGTTVVGEVVTPIRNGSFVNNGRVEGWTLIRTESGVEGWLNNTYLQHA
jgi:N-acetylmuramoyl-L-alanine amidase